MKKEIQIDLYRWAGQWGPFRIKIPCGECTLTSDIIKDTLDKELAGIPVKLNVQDWLSVWWKALKSGGWHAPIVTVQGKMISQGAALNRGVLTQAVIEANAANLKPEGSFLFGKLSCPHCVRAKKKLDEAGIPYEYRDVVEEPRFLYEMLGLVKPIVGPKTPITVPQIWLDGKYIGGADNLEKSLAK